MTLTHRLHKTKQYTNEHQLSLFIRILKTTRYQKSTKSQIKHRNMKIERHTSPEGILVFCLTRDPAATMACFSTTTPSRRIAPIPTNASSSIVHPCTTALWPVCSNFKLMQIDFRMKVWYANYVNISISHLKRST